MTHQTLESFFKKNKNIRYFENSELWIAEDSIIYRCTLKYFKTWDEFKRHLYRLIRLYSLRTQNTYLFSCVQGAKWQWIQKTYWHKIEKYVFFLQTREVNICSIPSVQHIFSLSLKLAILLFVRHNIRIFDFSTFHNIMSFLFDMIFFEFLNKFFLQQSIILCTFNI